MNVVQQYLHIAFTAVATAHTRTGKSIIFRNIFGCELLTSR